ncbi:hypothetical protein [Phormidesmis priestleyi]|uniref:hypothetical protein n=1 Tax=Phormidesmis priestleyi TaxID=268141 RepID=UPI0015E65736|nr:hypothetical protein [Phormidesmis priestleyi]
MPKQIFYAEACDNFEQVYGKALSGQEPIEGEGRKLGSCSRPGGRGAGGEG